MLGIQRPGQADAAQSAIDSDLRKTVAREGPSKLLETFRQYPEPGSATIKTKADAQFLREIASGGDVSPSWIASSPDFDRARALAIYFLAVDYQNRHFLLSQADLRLIRGYARLKLTEKNSELDIRREALRSLGATAELADIATIESIAQRSNDAQEIQEALVSLALICDVSAGIAMERVLDSKQSILSEQFHRLVVESRATKQKSMCAK